MPFPLIPVVAVMALGGAGVVAHRKMKSRVLTQKHQQIFDRAYQTLEPPAKLRQLADSFEKAGHKHHAKLLRQRAALREMPPEQKAQNKAIIRKAFQSKNAAAIRKVAKTFKKMGALGTSQNLMKHATRVEKAEAVRSRAKP